MTSPIRPIRLISFLLALLLAACTMDAYDKGEGELSLMRAELVLAFTDSQSFINTVETDEGECLTLTQPLKMGWANRPDSAYRLVLYYNKVMETQAEVVAFGPVGVLTAHYIDDVKTDPVRFESAWLSTNRRFLNVGLYLMSGATENDSVRHVVGMALDTLSTDTATRCPTVLGLKLYHDQAGVPEYYSQRTYLSVPLDSLPPADSICLSVNTYNGVITHAFSLNTEQ